MTMNTPFAVGLSFSECRNGIGEVNVPDEIVILTHDRLMKVDAVVISHYGADQVLLPQRDFVLPYLDSNRRFVNSQGIYRADVIFVPLEDGDRCEALIRSGRKVITIDLNPLSRTAKAATITIVDNIVRALPLLLDRVRAPLEDLLKDYDNSRTLREARLEFRLQAV